MKKISIVTGSVIALVLNAFSICAQSQSREDLLRVIAAKHAELSKLEKAFLAPSEEDRARYADFLRQPDTGLFRLLPREVGNDPESRLAVTIRGGGTYYSFMERTNEAVNSSAIALEQGQFTTMLAGANYSMFVSLGDVPLESVSSETTAAQVLAQQTPAEDEPHARIEQRKAMQGASVGGVAYKERQLAKVNSTYVLRSINYSTSDVLVAFRVVRVDNDDSVTIIWKLLKKYPTPYLARN
jgi:mannose/fructose-specific phosphotransferase system component IIA